MHASVRDIAAAPQLRRINTNSALLMNHKTETNKQLGDRMKQLIIVESPHKAKTIQKYLGNDAAVLASKGHVCDLPTRSLGIDVDNGFKPQYIVTPDKEATIKQL